MLCHPQESKKLQNKHWEHIQYKEMKDKTTSSQISEEQFVTRTVIYLFMR